MGLMLFVINVKNHTRCGLREDIGHLNGGPKLTGDFASELGHGVKTKHPLDRFVSGFINKLIVHYIIKWLDHCFETYNEGYFHLQMSQGFNFMSDMKINHTSWYNKFMKGARL